MKNFIILATDQNGQICLKKTRNLCSDNSNRVELKPAIFGENSTLSPDIVGYYYLTETSCSRHRLSIPESQLSNIQRFEYFNGEGLQNCLKRFVKTTWISPKKPIHISPGAMPKSIIKNASKIIPTTNKKRSSKGQGKIKRSWRDRKKRIRWQHSDKHIWKNDGSFSKANR